MVYFIMIDRKALLLRDNGFLVQEEEEQKKA